MRGISVLICVAACGGTIHPTSDSHSLLNSNVTPVDARALGTGAAIHLPASGAVTLVDFWSTSCHPCERLMPEIEKMRADFGGQLVVIGVAHDDNPVAVQEKAKALGVTYPIVLDDDGRLDRAFQVGGVVPTTFVVDAKGRVTFVKRGQTTGDIDAIRAATKEALR